MEIRTLRYFMAVAREENMTRAAEQLHVSQPTLSKALRSLEEELGKKLFTRHSFSIKLTEEGVLLRNRAEDLVSMADKIEQEFLSLDDISGGDIYFGLAETYQIRYLAREILTPIAMIFRWTANRARYTPSYDRADEILSLSDQENLPADIRKLSEVKECRADRCISEFKN